MLPSALQLILIDSFVTRQFDDRRQTGEFSRLEVTVSAINLRINQKPLIGKMSSMSVVVLRDYHPGDEIQCQDIIREATMSTVNVAFISGLTREFTFQLMVLVAAVMYIFIGIPLKFCLYVIPGVIIFIYICIWAAHSFKALELNQDINNIPRVYMSSDSTGFWVAEAYEPYFASTWPDGKAMIVNESGLKSCGIDINKCRRTIVGTVAIACSRESEDVGWLRRMAVRPQYQRRGIAKALLREAVSFCRTKGYKEVELVTSECHDAARELYLSAGFDVKQMYHKPIVGNLITLTMYQLIYKLQSNQVKSDL
ncbi:hypothetical protein B566_EDAN001732 [Ephemera danica]|nr:hypothetical protein B566_EDAN001732 [Ephemera danica]